MNQQEAKVNHRHNITDIVHLHKSVQLTCCVDVFTVLRNCCNQINETRVTHPSNTLSVSSESSKASMSTLTSAASVMSESLMMSPSQLTESLSLESRSSMGQVGVEISHLLSRLVFPRHLQVRTVTPTRQVVIKWSY